MAFNLGTFPLDSVMFEKYTHLFEAGKNTVVVFMPTLIIARALSNMLNSRGTDEYWQIIKDTFTAILLLTCFMGFLRFVLDLPGFFSSLFEDSGTYSMSATDQDHRLLSYIMNYITIATFWIGAAIYAIFLILMSSIAAYIIAFGIMLRSSWVVKAFFWLLIIMSSWPLLWYIFNMAIRYLSQEDGFVNSILVIFFNILKALTPLIGAAIGLKSPVASAARSTVGGAADVLGKTAKFAETGINKLGGKPVIDNLAAKTSMAKMAVDSTLSKTIPTLGSAAGAMGSVIGKGYKSFAPQAMQSKLGSAQQKISSTFKNSTDTYSGQEYPGTSPAMLAIKAVPKNIAGGARSAITKTSSAQKSASTLGTTAKPGSLPSSPSVVKNTPATNYVSSNIGLQEISRGESVKSASTLSQTNLSASNSQGFSSKKPLNAMRQPMNSSHFKKNRILTENKTGGRQ